MSCGLLLPLYGVHAESKKPHGQQSLANSSGDSPQGIRATPNGTFVVVANHAPSNVSALSLAPGTGVLTNGVGSPFADRRG